MKLTLRDSVEKVPLVGPLQAKKLKRLNIESVDDLLNHYPFRYDDFTNIKKISELVFGETATVIGTVVKIENVYTKNRKNIVKAVIADETGRIDVIWFNQPYLVKNLKTDTHVSLSGKVDEFSHHLALISPEYEFSTLNFQPSTNIHTGRLVPVYPETYGLSSKWLRSRISSILENELEIGEVLPPEILKENRLLGLKEALLKVHFPKNLEEAKEAKRRLAFDEVFEIIYLAQKQRKKWQTEKSSFQLSTTTLKPKLTEFINRLPFELTNDQNKAMEEILDDMKKKTPMNRLLQGEVGSGKTVVAAVSALATVLSGYKVLYMAPTEILSNQHYQTFQKLFHGYNTKINLITSSSRRNQNFQISSAGRSDQILVGTHALLYQIGQIEKVGLVIIDEQHKFGVGQRAKLLDLGREDNGKLPHFLTMTATPIPRTLQLTLLGDLNISSIENLPNERKKIKTWLVPKYKRTDAYHWIKNQVAEAGAQAYIICPFIDESESETLKSVKAAKKEFESLQKMFHPLNVGLLHGKMKSGEKEEIMNKFRDDEVKILVCTPVVEVGIDNPLATIILIEGAERFGLASLHQLRGRVGRGNKQAYCFLFTDSESPETQVRLKSLEKIKSGLKLAEADLKNRGSGTIFGSQQSGPFKTKIADFSDLELVIQAGRAVARFITKYSESDYERRLIDHASEGNKEIHGD
ncbi:MAG: ATP-dependent DNA helicase RecG [Patescibacteria group bacterium]|nr:ATP-dependent DNA helicase RecG [Patescibacteria group bacterium]